MNKRNYDIIFRRVLSINDEEPVEEKTILDVDNWNSFEHFRLINEIEEFFNISFSEQEMMCFNSYKSGIEILIAHGVKI